MKNFYLFVLSIALVVPGLVRAQDAAAPAASTKKELILKFIDVFGTKDAMKQNLDEMLKTLPEDEPDTKKLKANINVDEIIDRLVPIYDKQFSEAELKAFIAFYSSPEGQKLVRGIPVIMRDSVDVSTQYFQEKFPEMQETEQTTQVNAVK
jgi:hypothetical protein